MLYKATMILLAAIVSVTTLSAYENADKSSYLLSPVDKVEVTVFRQPNMKTLQRIDGQGSISMPLLGDVTIGGLSVGEAEKKIAQAYVDERYLRAPSVNISIQEYAPKTITVLGQVQSPGEVEMPKEANEVPLTKAIALAGGFTRLADEDKVTVIRTMPSGKELRYTINVEHELQERSSRNSVRMQVSSGDVILVPESMF